MKSLNAIPAWTKCLFFVFLASCQFPVLAQDLSRSELESRRKKLIADIEKTADELATTRQTREATLNRFLILRRSIRQRTQLIQTLQQEVAFTENSITRTQQVLGALEGDLDRLRREYSKLLRVALKHKLSQSYVQFLFSSRSINDAFQRWQYIRQYERYRKRQAKLIVETQQTLTHKSEQLELDKMEKDSLLEVVFAQQSDMEAELQTKNKLLVVLQSDEKRLAGSLEKQEVAHQELNAMIESVIRKEMLANRKRSRTKEALEEVNKKKTETSSSGPVVGQDFSQQRGKLPWPVNGGEVIKPFGSYNHPKFKAVKLTNNGIDIRTTAPSTVRSVYGGKVAGTQFIPGYQNTVIIQHGAYYTVYSNLAELFVKRGDEVSQNQEIGRLDAAKPEIHFEVWQEKRRLNPEHWVNGK